MLKKIVVALLTLTLSLSLCSLASADGINLRLRRSSNVVPYDPGGVLFWQEGGATYIGASNLNGGVDTRHGIVAFRRMLWLGTPGVQGPTNNFRSSANFGTYGNGTCSLEGCIGYAINADNSPWTVDGTGFAMHNTLANADGSPPNSSTKLSGPNYAFDFVWQSVVTIYDTNAAANSRKIVTFVDGVLFNTTTTDVGVAFDVTWNTSRGTFINNGNRGSGIQTGGALMLADVIVDTATPIPAPCSLANPTTCQFIADAFYAAGKPVNPGTNSTNCTAFTAAISGVVNPDWCLRGDTTTFLTNTGGTAQAMAVGTSITGTPRTTGNGGSVLYNAPYGQGAEPTDRPYLAWAAPASYNLVSTSSTTSCTGGKCNSNTDVMGNFGGKILAGDRLFIVWFNCLGSTAASVTLPTISAGWTAVASSTSTNPAVDAGSNQRCQWAVWTHVATANYVDVNVPWVAGNPYVDPPTITYATTGVAPSSVGFEMFNYRSANGVVNIDISDFAGFNRNSLASSTIVLPSVTTTKTTETLVSVCSTKTPSRPINPPVGEDARHINFYNAGSAVTTVVADEKLTSAGATGTRTYTRFGTASTNDRDYCGLMGLANN